MSDYTANIRKENDGSFYALVVRIDDEGYTHVCRYKGRHFKTEKAALRSTAKYIAILDA